MPPHTTLFFKKDLLKDVGYYDENFKISFALKLEESINLKFFGTDTVTTGTHNLNTGDQVVYANGGGTDITGLTGGTTYFAIVVDATNIKNISVRFFWSDFNEKPILEILLAIDNRFIENSLLKLKKRKKIEVIKIR